MHEPKIFPGGPKNQPGEQSPNWFPLATGLLGSSIISLESVAHKILNDSLNPSKKKISFHHPLSRYSVRTVQTLQKNIQITLKTPQYLILFQKKRFGVIVLPVNDTTTIGHLSLLHVKRLPILSLIVQPPYTVHPNIYNTKRKEKNKYLPNNLTTVYNCQFFSF